MGKGKQRMSEVWEQLKTEWFEASFGSAIFWTPLIFVNMTLVPQHSRILFLLCFSFLHKTWLSWVSNRQLVAAQRAAEKYDHISKVEKSPPALAPPRSTVLPSCCTDGGLLTNI